jgi:putative ABC transport system permease protein
MNARELLDQARDGLVSNRLRASLSALGIVVGIGTVVASLAIGEGARRSAMADIGALGIDNVFVRAVAHADGPKSPSVAPELTIDDAFALSGVSAIDEAASVRLVRGEVVAGTRRASAQVAGVTENWSRIANVDGVRGRWLTGEDVRTSRRVAILGSALARTVGADRDPIGLSISVNGEFFSVVGVLDASKHSAGAIALQSFGADAAVVVPISAMDQSLGAGDAIDRVSEVIVRAEPRSDVERVAKSVAGLLARRHPGATDRYELVVPHELLQARLRAQRTFDSVLLATGCIALIIAGVGIMNVMLASVTERRQEIGVRLAVGARRRDVVMQFTLEAGLLCLAGGALGVPLGALLSWIVSAFAGWPEAVSAGGVGLALVLAMSVGLAFGIYPAYLAASNDPVEALRG